MNRQDHNQTKRTTLNKIREQDHVWQIENYPLMRSLGQRVWDRDLPFQCNWYEKYYEDADFWQDVLDCPEEFEWIREYITDPKK